MTLFKRTALVAAMLPLYAPVSWGLGLGDITMKSYLNEPLRAEVKLLDVQGLTADDIRIRLATQEDFDRVGVERAYFLTSVKFDVVIEDGDGRILLSTDQPLLEPYLDFLVETRWPSGRLLREYTVLVDLPARAETVRVASSAKGPSEPGSGDRASAAVAREAAALEQGVDDGQRRLVSPSERPKRRYDSEATDLPTPGGRYLVKANDTLWDIASAARPEGASVEQTMIATVDMNGDAFTGGNINGLKAGYVLELPSESEILTSRGEAIDTVASQNRDWAAGVRRAPALRVVADNEFSTDDQGLDQNSDLAEADLDVSGVDDGNVSSAAADEFLASEDADTVAGESSAAAAVASNGDALTEARTAELAAIQERLGQLSEQVGSLRQLVAVKDQQIAALQAELAQREEREAAARSAPAAVTASPAPATTSELGGLPWWVYALGGVVLVAIGGVIFARRADRRYQAAVTAPLSATQRAPVPRETTEPLSPAPADPVPAPKDAGKVAGEIPADDGERGYGKKLHNDYAEENALSDAIAEADIYVAYGRLQQALNLLESVAASGADNAKIHLKMVDIYLKCDRREEAEALLPRIEQTHDVEALRKAMDLLATPETAAAKVDLGELADAPSLSAAPKPTEAVEDDVVDMAPLDFELVSHQPPTKSPEPPTQEATLDLELELPELESNEPAEEAIESTLGTADWGDLSETVDAVSDDRLPPELAAVLGTDVPPPLVSDHESDDDDALIYAAETDPMDTKLDLARAYIDMGDEDGARPVLEEVIAKGDLQQQAEARELLVRID